MTNEELERIDELLQASGLLGKEYEIKQQEESPYDFSVSEKYEPGIWIAPEAMCGTLPVAELYAAAPAAIDALLAEVNRLRNQLQARMVLLGEFDN